MLRYAATIFLSAFLLFQVQPIVGKFIVPHFGGSAGVWTTCMLFFQALLLGGYAYAHLLASRLSNRRQAVLHAILMAVCLAFLPLSPAADRWTGDTTTPAVSILLLLALQIGLPYLVLSSTGPLLQSWFARSRPGESPYRLYALSNLGSLLGLVTYPLVFEPLLSRQLQGWLWSAGFVAFAATSGFAAWALSKTPDPGRSTSTAGAKTGAPAFTQVLLWVGLAAAASVMLIATTSRLSTDIAAMPMLWVLPLSIYLLTFIICFERDRWYDRRVFAVGYVAVVVWACIAFFIVFHPSLIAQLALYSSILFVTCMLAHGEIARTRPAAEHLTLFYLAIALGGALGGVLAAFAAPQLLNDYWEFELGLIAVGVLAFASIARATWRQFAGRGRVAVLGGGALVLVAIGSTFGHFMHRGATGRESLRNFYGVLHLQQNYCVDGSPILELVHGNTVHGRQFIEEHKRRWPTTYYAPESGIGYAIDELARLRTTNGERQPMRIGVIGLGAGTLAAHAGPGDAVVFYEINPIVEKIAREQFTFLGDTTADVDVRIGDARVVMQREFDSGDLQRFDVLAIDAFSSDAIPLHLITREAFALYDAHLAEGGVIAFHISNRFVALEPVVRGLAQPHGYQCLVVNSAVDDVKGSETSEWVLVSKNTELLAAPDLALAAELPPDDPELVEWTDDYASIVPMMAGFSFRPGRWVTAPNIGGLVVDWAETLTPDDNRKILRILRRLYAATEGDYPVAFVLLSGIPDEFAQYPDPFGAFKQWMFADMGMLGHGRLKAGLMLMVVRGGGGTIHFEHGHWNEADDERFGQMVAQNLIPAIESGQPSAGFVKVAEALDQMVRARWARYRGIGR